MNKLKLTIGLGFLANILHAQSSNSNDNLLFYGMVAVSAVLVIWAMLALASNLMKIEAHKHGLNTDGNNFSVFPGISDFFKPKKPLFITEGSFHKLTKGFDIKLEGIATGKVEKVNVSRFAIKPQNFNGMSPIPKIVVEVGDEVKAGDILFFDKKRPEIQYVAPVSGEIVDIRRGEKRSIAEVVILADKEVKYKSFTAPDLNTSDRTKLVSFFAESGLLTLINERPFDIVPDLDSIPVNIFISTFDSAPLGPDSKVIISGNEAAFQKGIDVLSKLTSGKVHLGLDARSEENTSKVFSGASNVEKHWFSGPHPSGNCGIQIHHIAPIKGNEKVWTLGIQEVISIGNMFINGEYHAERIIALTGGELKTNKYVTTYQGASISDLLKSDIKGDNVRIISGDVLSGKQSSLDGFIDFKDDQITVIKEGNENEFLGWLVPIAPRPSISGTFPNFLYSDDYKFEVTTNTHGEKRAFVVSGEYESVLPMDIYPQHLMKAIITQDFEKMDGLGITELTEEDVALCEFVCTSKNPLQSILRQGLNFVKEQS